MSILTKLALGSIAALALFGRRRAPVERASTAHLPAGVPVSETPAARARRKPGKRRAQARRPKSA